MPRHPLPLALLIAAVALPAAAQDGPPTLAIADLDNHTGDPSLDGAGAGVASVLLSKLARLEAVQVVERARLQELLAEMELATAGVVDPATAAEAGKLLGADYIVLGSLFSLQLPAIAVSIRVVEVATGTVLVADEVTGTIGEGGEEFFVLLDEIGYRILDALEVRLASRDRIELGQIEVRRLDTVQVYGAALEALDRDETDAAQDLLARATALEPGFRLAEETLDRLAAQVSSRRSAFAHANIEAVHAAWQQLEAALAPRIEAPEATVDSIAAQALWARLMLVRGDFETYFALERARIGHVEVLLATVDLDEEHPEHDFREACQAEVVATGATAQFKSTFRALEFWPYAIRAQLAELSMALGRVDEGMALAIEAYQRRGPRRRADDGPMHPMRFAERWDQWDAVVLFRQQVLRQRELAGDAEGEREALDELDDALEKVRALRDEERACRETLGRLDAEPASEELLDAEQDCVSDLGDHPALALPGYAAFLRRTEAGYYGALRSEPDFRSVAGGWQKRVDALLNDPWFIEQRLQHLLTYQELVPPRDADEQERYREALERMIERGYKR